MNQINCPICGNKCVKAGKTKAGTQRWLCKKCKTSLTHKIDNDSKELQIFLDWLFGKETQSIMPGKEEHLEERQQDLGYMADATENRRNQRCSFS